MDFVTIHGSMTPGITHGTHTIAHGIHGALGTGADTTMIRGMAAGMADHITPAGMDGATIHSGTEVCTMAVHTGAMIHSIMTGTTTTIIIQDTSTVAPMVSERAIHGARVKGILPAEP